MRAVIQRLTPKVVEDEKYLYGTIQQLEHMLKELEQKPAATATIATVLVAHDLKLWTQWILARVPKRNATYYELLPAAQLLLGWIPNTRARLARTSQGSPYDSLLAQLSTYLKVYISRVSETYPTPCADITLPKDVDASDVLVALDKTLPRAEGETPAQNIIKALDDVRRSPVWEC